MDELRLEDPASYRNYLRMDEQTFNELLVKMSPLITKADTNMREAISPGERLALTLRFLATGETYQSMEYSTRVSATTIGRFVPEVCRHLYECLKEDYLKLPSTEEEWLVIAKGFETRWNFPHCLGALDGKHVVFRSPLNQGSYFYNYKGTHSLVLFALVDSDYKFLLMVDAGTNGRVGDGGVFRKSDLNSAMKDGTINFPPHERLTGGQMAVPYFIVGDDAFPLQKDLMKPYPFRDMDISKRTLNYRLSRARRVVENAFGILANRFRVFLAPILLSPEKVEILILAACALHNFLRVKKTNSFYPPGSLDREDTARGTVCQGHWRNVKKSKDAYVDVSVQSGNRTTYTAQNIRDELRRYVNSDDGRVPWQNKFIKMITPTRIL
ncbi:uncharacterized protein LOC135494929 [Lineus longissimus]|uniref:uncharacterized protein LOC135494929 n=1 Tax=Lineus longissimus TaxID=88925 RepID=UPI00315D0005